MHRYAFGNALFIYFLFTASTHTLCIGKNKSELKLLRTDFLNALHKRIFCLNFSFRKREKKKEIILNLSMHSYRVNWQNSKEFKNQMLLV